MAIAPSSAALVDVLPSRQFDLLDRLDQDFGYLVDESDLGYWDSGRCSNADWDLDSDSDDDDRYAFVAQSLDYEPLDTDDYEYRQSLLY